MVLRRWAAIQLTWRRPMSSHNRNPPHDDILTHRSVPLPSSDSTNRQTFVQIETLDRSQQHTTIPCECPQGEYFHRIVAHFLESSYSSHLQSATDSKDLGYGHLIHDHMIRDGLEGSPFLGTLLLEMYLKCDASVDAHALFVQLRLRRIFSWNLIIRSFSKLGQYSEALQCFDRILAEGIIPDKFTFVSLLSVCIRRKDINMIHRIHINILSCGCEDDVVVGNALVNAYAKGGSLMDAQKLFDSMSEHDSVTWNTLIVAYVHHGVGNEAVYLFDQLQQQGSLPTKATFVSILDICATLWTSAKAKQMLARIFGSKQDEDVVVSTALISMYSSCGCFDDAWIIFHRMHECNTVSWNAIIAACAHAGKTVDGVQVYRQMLNEAVLPSKTTFLCTLSVCSNPDAVIAGKYMHACIMGSSFHSDMELGNALVGMYSKAGTLQETYKTFHELPQKSVVAWTTLITALGESGESKHAFHLFSQMSGEGVLADRLAYVSMLDACASIGSLAKGRQIHACIVGVGLGCDLGVVSALVNMYGKCGNLKNAWRMFDMLPEWDAVQWTTMINAHSQHGHVAIAIQIFYQMQEEGILPNKITLISVLDACALEALLFEGQKLHAVASCLGFDALLGTSLVEMYGKCGRLIESKRAFEETPQKDVVLWTAMMAALAQNGKLKEALHLFDQMHHIGLSPDHVSFTNVLSMCSHTGLVDEGRRYFSSMYGSHGISPTVHHYNCMIDLLGRAGCLNEAEDMIKNMAVPPTALQWMTLLSACRWQLDVERGERAARHVFQLDPENPVPYVMLSNIYAAADRNADAALILSKVRERF